MNLGSHVAVACHLYPGRPRVWLGAALPDLGSIGGIRLLGETADRSLGQGIALHHQTDHAFHRSTWFTGRQRQLTDRLAEGGLGRGAARAIAHVGPELLLDGALHLDRPTGGIDSQALCDSIDQALAEIEHHPYTLSSLVPADPDGWLTHLTKVAALGPPDDYDDPRAVAYRLHRILRSRPRLAFDESDLDLVADELALEWPEISRTGPEFVSGLANELGQASPTVKPV